MPSFVDTLIRKNGSKERLMSTRIRYTEEFRREAVSQVVVRGDNVERGSGHVRNLHALLENGIVPAALAGAS